MPSDAPLRIRASGLGKTYRIYDRPWHRLAEALGGSQRHRQHVALESLDFELRAGQTLGVVGQNGAGKSTLLKLLAGVLQPTHGELEVHGTVSSILELGAGFHPDFTGHQNIRINAAMLGLSEAQLEERLPDIVEFCELGTFLDQPVKVYSSGMSMRLAFSIAAQVRPEILIIDEALSVGDGYFQKKCMDRILELIEGGTSLLFCSHAMYYVSTLCQAALWLRDGRVAAHGETDEVVRAYEEYLLAQDGARRAGAADPDDSEEADLVSLAGETSSGPARIRSLHVEGDGVAVSGEDGLRPGATLAIEVGWSSRDPDQRFQVGIGVNRLDGVEVFALDTRDADLDLVGSRDYCVRFEVPDQPLLRGQFTVHAFVLDEKGLHSFDHRVLHDAFRVASLERYEFGILKVPFHVERRSTP